MRRSSLGRHVIIAVAAVGLLVTGGPGAVSAAEPANVMSRQDKPAVAAPPSSSKIDPMLVPALADPKAGERMQVIVGFQDDLAIPRFPSLDPALPRNGPANAQTQRR